MGPAAHPGGTRPARRRGRRAHRRQVHAPDVASAVAHVARLPHRACPRHRRHRLLRGPTLTFRLLFVFVVLRHDRRELLHLNVTDHPTADWTARQILQTFPEETAPRYMLRDRDTIYGESFTRCIASMGIREVRMAPRAPWQNAFVERVIGSIRRECLDHVIILSEAHLGRVLRAYLAYYNATRPHQSLDNHSPHPRVVERQPCRRIIAIPQVGGLHHRYRRVA